MKSQKVNPHSLRGLVENPTRREHAIEVLVVLLLFVAVNLASLAFQKPLTYNEGQGWDGIGYYATAAQFAQGQIPRGEAPFVYRIGTSLLAGLFIKSDLLLSFKLVNLIANLLAVILLIIWLRFYIRSWKLRTLLVFLFITQWHAPIRYNYFLPASVEPWLLVVLLAGLIAITSSDMKLSFKSILALSLITGVGVAFKEVAMLIPLAVLFSRNPIDFHAESIPAFAKNFLKNVPLLYVIPLLAGLASFAAIHLLISQSNRFSFPVEAVNWAYDKPLLTWIHAWLIAFGPILVIVIYDWKKGWAFLAEHQFQLVFLIGVSFLAWIGGNDTERYLYMAMPVIFVLLGKAIENNRVLLGSVAFVAVLVLGQSISQRVLWSTPDFPSTATRSLILLTPLGSDVPYLDLWSYAWRSAKVTSLLEYLLFGFALFVWLKVLAKRQLAKINSVPL